MCYHVALLMREVHSHSPGMAYGYSESGVSRVHSRSIVSNNCADIYSCPVSQPIQTVPSDPRHRSSLVLFYQYNGKTRNSRAVRNAQCLAFPKQPCWAELSLRFFPLFFSYPLAALYPAEFIRTLLYLCFACGCLLITSRIHFFCNFLPKSYRLT